MTRATLSVGAAIAVGIAIVASSSSCGGGAGGGVADAIDVKPSWSTPTAPITPLHFGHNTVWSRAGLGVWDEAIHAPNVVVQSLARDLHPGILRFPGGTRAMRYHFDQAIGPLAQRKPQCDAFTGQTDATSYGIDEFFAFAESIGAEASLVAPWVDGSPQETAALVAYALGDPSSSVAIGKDDVGRDWGTAGEWAARRAANGHAAPYRVRLIEIGNEQYLDLAVGPVVSCGRASQFKQDERWVNGSAVPTTAADYATQLVATAALVRAIAPRARIGASAYASYDGTSDAAREIGELDRKSGSGDAWNARLVSSAKDAFDVFVLHPYDLTSSDNRLSLATRLEKAVRDLRALDPSKDIAVTEFGFLGGGDTMMNAIVSADVVRVAIEQRLVASMRHILVEDDPSGLFANAAAISGPSHTLTPAYFTMQALATSLSGDAIAIADPALDVSALATKDASGAIGLLFVDRRADAVGPTTLAIALPSGDFRGALVVVHGPALGATAADVVVDRTDVDAAGTLRLVLPPNAVAVARLAPL